MIRYPFVISRRKAVVVEATSLPNAIDRVTTKHPNKWIKINYAKNVEKHLNPIPHMDLISANNQVKVASKKQPKVQMYVILKEDEFEVTTDVDIDKDDIYSVWRGGVKIDSPKDNKVETKNENTNQMKTKSSTTKKVAAKKAAPVKKEKKNTVPRGNNMFLTPDEWKKVDAILAKEEITFSAWSRGLVQAKIK